MSGQADLYHKLLGIPPQEQPPTHYRLLGLGAFESDRAVIEAAADRQMMYLRTLRNGDTERLLNEVARARLCLLDRTKKAEYDRSLLDKPGNCKVDQVSPISSQDIDLERESSASVPPVPGECRLDPMLFEVIDRDGPFSRFVPSGPYSASQILAQVLGGHIHGEMEIRNVPHGEWYSIGKWMEMFYYGSSAPAKLEELSGMEQRETRSDHPRSSQHAGPSTKKPEELEISGDVAVLVIVAFAIVFSLWIWFAGLG